MLAALVLALQAAAPPPAPAAPVTPLSGVVVEAPRRAPPRLVRSYPAAGATAPFGVLVLTLAFDQPMDAKAGPGAPEGADAPACLPNWRLLNDARTFVLLCRLEAGRRYGVRLPGASGAGFRGAGARAAEPVELAFSTDPDKIDPDLAEALRSAGLKPEEGPVMDWRGPRPGA